MSAAVSPELRQTVSQKVTENLKVLFPMAQGADEQLEVLKEKKQANFAAIFPEGSPFKARSTRFLPYLVEVAEQVKQLETVSDEDFTSQLKVALNKVQLLHDVLERFHSVKEQEAETSEPEMY